MELRSYHSSHEADSIRRVQEHAILCTLNRLALQENENAQRSAVKTDFVAERDVMQSRMLTEESYLHSFHQANMAVRITTSEKMLAEFQGYADLYEAEMRRIWVDMKGAHQRMIMAVLTEERTAFETSETTLRMDTEKEEQICYQSNITDAHTAWIRQVHGATREAHQSMRLDLYTEALSEHQVMLCAERNEWASLESAATTSFDAAEKAARVRLFAQRKAEMQEDVRAPVDETELYVAPQFSEWHYMLQNRWQIQITDLTEEVAYVISQKLGNIAQKSRNALASCEALETEEQSLMSSLEKESDKLESIKAKCSQARTLLGVANDDKESKVKAARDIKKKEEAKILVIQQRVAEAKRHLETLHNKIEEAKAARHEKIMAKGKSKP
jgi:hypothetical protein